MKTEYKTQTNNQCELTLGELITLCYDEASKICNNKREAAILANTAIINLLSRFKDKSLLERLYLISSN